MLKWTGRTVRAVRAAAHAGRMACSERRYRDPIYSHILPRMFAKIRGLSVVITLALTGFILVGCSKSDNVTSVPRRIAPGGAPSKVILGGSFSGPTYLQYQGTYTWYVYSVAHGKRCFRVTRSDNGRPFFFYNDAGPYDLTWPLSQTFSDPAQPDFVWYIDATDDYVPPPNVGCVGNSLGSDTLAVTVEHPLYAPVSVYIDGPTYIFLHQSAQYTANASGGTGGFTYQWRTRFYSPSSGWGAWSNWFSTGTTNYTWASVNGCGINEMEIGVQVTDSRGVTSTSTHQSNVTNPC